VPDVPIFNGIMASGFSEAGATAALTGDQRYLDDTVKAFQRRRDILTAELEKIPGIKFVVPDGGYFFIANISAFGVPAREFCRDLLEEENVAITPMNAWGADDFGDQHVRFIFTNESEERLAQAASRIGAFVKRHDLARSPA
jgi:aspartate aminotransferase